MATSTAAAALASVKGKPAFIRVILDDGEVQKIAVPNVKRWKARTSQIIDSTPWRSIEPLDAKDNLVGPRLDNTDQPSGAATDMEDLEIDPNHHTSVASLLSLMLRAQDMALVRQSQAYGVVLDNNQKLLTVISARLESMEKHAHHNFQIISQLHNQVNESSDSDDDMVSDIMAMVKLKNEQGEPKPQT